MIELSQAIPRTLSQEQRNRTTDVPVPAENACNSVPKARYGEGGSSPAQALRCQHNDEHLYAGDSRVGAAVEALDPKTLWF